LDRVRGPEHGGKKSYKVSIWPISCFNRGEIKGTINKEEEKYGGQEMDEYIYEVVAKNAVLPEIVVEG